MRGDPATIRSDVYSLGVVLYELLCGERPSLGAFQQDLSRADRGNDAHLPQDVRAIALKAIQWDPEERYGSVDAFAADIQRYLNGTLPVASSRLAFEDETVEQVSIAILPLREPDTDTNTKRVSRLRHHRRADNETQQSGADCGTAHQCCSEICGSSRHSSSGKGAAS
ncbi:MAG: hypothetical protein ACR2IV_14985 [Bryobacteraceae bacterium]